MNEKLGHIKDLATYDDLDSEQKLDAIVEYIDECFNAQNILILDIETTGFLQAGGKIVEIGIVELNLTNGKRRIIYDKVCHEDGLTKELVEKAWIINNSDLTVEEIRQSKNLNLIKEEVQHIIDSYPLGITAFNNSFDFGFMESRGFNLKNKLPCPMILSTDICKIPNKNGRGTKWPKVQEAYDFFFEKNDYEEKHRGADDALHEARIVHKLFEMGVFKLN